MSQSKFKVGSLIGGAALVALGVAFAGQATAGDARVVKSSSDKVSLKVTGQFSTEMHVIDDGFSTRVLTKTRITARAVFGLLLARRLIIT